jgi:hypothetical protein
MPAAVITSSHLAEDFGISAELIEPLEAPWSDAASFEQTVAAIRGEAAIEEEDLKVLLVLLQQWHTMLVGPPGTGKTMLAELAAEIWNVNLIRVTPSMDWTSFHAIGGKAPSGGGLEPYDGAVTAAILDCCRTIAEREALGEGRQGTWLLIDEINRCEVDRVFSPLLSALGSRLKPQVLDLPYRDEPTRRRLTLPPRFRIIATANFSDAQFIQQMSQAFIRRFQRIDVRAPEAPPQTAIETFEIDDPAAIANGFLQEMAIVHKTVANARPGIESLPTAVELIAQLALLARYGLRWDGYGSTPEREEPRFDTVAIGTAQLIDALLLAAELEGSPAGLSLEDAVDVAAARTIAPQLGRAGPASLAAIRAALEKLYILPRVGTELESLISRFESGSYF